MAGYTIPSTSSASVETLINRAPTYLGASISPAQTVIPRSSLALLGSGTFNVGWPGDTNGASVDAPFRIVATDNTNYEIMQVVGGYGTASVSVNRAVEPIGGVQVPYAFSNAASVTTLTPVATARGLFAGLGPQIVTFTTSTTWTVPPGVTNIEVFLVGGGGGGGGGASVLADGGGGGGGGGQVLDWVPVVVAPGQVLTITNAASVAGGANNANGTNGNAASVTGSSPTVSLVALGGGGGGEGLITRGGFGGNAGGSLSGGGTIFVSTFPAHGSSGGGGMGGLSTTTPAGAGGQEPYFGYGGGGGGGAESGNTGGGGSGFSGGAGGIGANGTAGTPFTGGGGGGGGSRTSGGGFTGGGGASGFCAIMWIA